jgi:NAD(P)-dependent dehydrogenase (short-subunit alcohol dehydrogenase family)
VAIVTGAGGGIGRAVSLLLATAGYCLTLVGRTEATLERTSRDLAELVAAPPGTLIVPADIGDAEQAMSVVDMTLEQWGRADVLVNNAGAAPSAPLDETNQDLLYRTFAINAFGPFHLVARLWPIFGRQKSGCVVNVSSIATVDPFPGLSVYAASKAAMESLTRSIVQEGRQQGITAYSVLPGAVETPMLRRLLSREQLPADQTLEPSAVARVIVDCILGERPSDLGRTIQLPSPS